MIMALQALGEELYPMVEELYPELAPRLTGMLLQLGESECRACVHDQNKLAERLGEALEILDSDPSDQRVSRAETTDPGEKRIDPEDGIAKTLQQLRTQHRGQYTQSEIDEYWQTCKPVRSGGAQQSSSVDARSTSKAKSNATAKSSPVLAKAPAAPKPKVAPSKENVVAEPIKGLSAWLNILDLGSYFKAAAEWVEEQGAVNLEELVENLEDFADDLKFTGPERKRLELQAEDAIASAKAAPISVANESNAVSQTLENPSDRAGDCGNDDFNEEHDSPRGNTFDQDSSPAKRCPKAASSQNVPKATVTSRPKQEPLPSAGKGKGKQNVATQEQRIDPSDGMARTLSELHEHYIGEYSPQEIEEYWRDCRPIGTSESAPVPSSQPSVTRSGFGNGAKAPSVGVSPPGQAPKAKAGGYWGSGSKMRF